ncbi:sensor histidine kinase [Nocardia sp. 2]|uniref:Sensor histidine kinase n=1 Tax=Nocardia acididurans TaxID=2802282 RepID=A0ABS1M1P3_9NOCA|nr:sensor histidine kinase [Nocardia acididurans]
MLAVLWLIFLVGPLRDRWAAGDHLVAAVSAAGLLIFAVLVVTVFALFRQPDWDDAEEPVPAGRAAWVLLAALAALCLGLTLLLGGTALPAAIYVGVAAIFMLPSRQSAVIAVLTGAAMLALPLLLPTLLPGWMEDGVPLYLALVPPAVWVGRELGMRGRRLRTLARRQQAEIAIIEERNRVARDVHDILGHSLTVITVKTQLAQRLIDIDPERAKAELADMERLAREALAGVRTTVGGLREVTLPGELANARTALAAAEIRADLPDPGTQPTDHSVLFGWVLREAVTNIVRHSRATRCTVRITTGAIEIEDNGIGLPADAPTGTGLSGLHERVAAAGGTLTLANRPEGGLRVLASFPPTPAATR